MARLTFNVELSSKADRSGRWQVMVRLHQKGQKPGRVLTSVKIENAPKFWDAELLKKEKEKDPSTKRKVSWGKWVVKHPKREPLNTEILAEYERIKKLATGWLEETPYLTPTLLADRFREGISDLYFPLLDKVVEQAKSQAYGTYLNKKSARDLFYTFLADKAEGATLQSITPITALSFQSHLQDTKSIRGDKRKASSINEIIGRLNTLHEEVLMSRGIPKKQATLQSPWTEIEPLTETKTPKAKLNEQTIERVTGIQIESKRRVVTHEMAFQIWLLARVLAGARISDVLKLRYREFELNEAGEPVHLRYEMMKTGHLISTPVFEEAQLLLKQFWAPSSSPDTYVLPLLKNSEPHAKLLTHEQYKNAPFEVRSRLAQVIRHWNKEINNRLREIEQKAKLPRPLRMHSARHSFADYALQIMKREANITLYDIQAMLGHGSLKTTEIYTRELEEKDLSESMQKIFKKGK
ncbi:hypothetical protein GCM10028805_22330 [Spirosoma harenae]